MVAPVVRYSGLVAIVLVATSVHVSQAPPPALPVQGAARQQQQEDGKFTGGGGGLEETADLTLLINETLRLNNKSAPESVRGNESFRDDWTFDRVEYDLMDFLQELNARYRYSNKGAEQQANSPPLSSPVVSSEGEQGASGASEAKASASDHQSSSAAANAGDASNQTTAPPPQVAASVHDSEATSAPGTKTNGLSGADGQNKGPADSPAPSSTRSTSASAPVLPISLATGDHDISESTWQYGIFDRFTRARPTTTPHPADVSTLSGPLDVRSFNSDECGLRSYRTTADHFPQTSQLDMEEVSKELSQRRQRPPMGSSFFQSHKKYGLTAAGDSVFDRELTSEELENREKLLPRPPPLDRNGEPALQPSESMIGGAAPNSDSSSLGGGADGEFNLSSRRQWLQQQLGTTLQMLGLNTSNQAALDYFINQTTHSAHAAPTVRETMMRMPADKLAKSLDKLDPLTSDGLPAPVKLPAGPLASDLKARQDELKLEARVIGGNDARLGDSPWSASLQALVSRPGTGGLEYRHYCGGTIISEYYILTAAHCLDFMVGRESRLFVVIGDLNWRMSPASMHGRRFGIEKLIIHSGYKSTAFGHDIGLIKTKESMRPLKVNGRYIINSVCLPERNAEHSGEAELVGWGLFSNRNEMADSLQIADVPILPRPLCVDLYRRRTGLIQWLIGIELITDKQICAGTFGRGICQGDSGSALVLNEKVSLDGKSALTRLRQHMVRDAQQRATIIGVVAFGGIRRCSYQSLPGVYMQTSKYLDWILPRIQQ